MLFALGRPCCLPVAFIFSTYSAVQMVDSGYSVFGVNIPVGTQTYPFQGIGIVTIVVAFIFTELAFFKNR